MRVLIAGVAALGFLGIAPAHASPDKHAGTFIGSSPCTLSIREALPVVCDVETGLLEWTLRIFPDGERYMLDVKYGPTAAGRHGLGDEFKVITRQGKWSLGKLASMDASVAKLEGALSFAFVGEDMVHALNPDGSLMIGNGGWSFTLNRADRVEKPADLTKLSTLPEVSYSMAPLASGPTLFGVFEGRTPCHGIAAAMGMTAHPACEKSKWRVTLMQDPATGAPSTYRVEGSMFRTAARTGKWKLEKNAAQGLIFALEAEGAPPVRLLRGDDDVLFFLRADKAPLVGTFNFSYTLNRRGG